ncbi:hypothetical protein [uncultured Streptomyces sp.]|uniref:hypothetical protein n=1 Tax=uncultured Streptomyces sp. TaxID=174707 RepID=UPI00260F257D|nr:hypothetical protein [uncultured Streptomyces sp.]
MKKNEDRAALPRRATWWCRVTGTAALVTGALTTANLMFPMPELGFWQDPAVRTTALTAVFTALWWIGALLAPPLVLPPPPAAPGSAVVPAVVPARLPRRRGIRPTLLAGLMLAALPLVVIRTIDAHPGPLEPAMPLLTGFVGLLSLFLLRTWLVSLADGLGGPHAGPAELRRDAAAGAVAARRVRVGEARWDGGGDVTWAERRLVLTADDRSYALRTVDGKNTRFRWLDLEPGIALKGQEGWLCWASAGGSWGDPEEPMGAALVTDGGHVVWGVTDRYQAETAYTPGHSHPTGPRRVRRAPRTSLYRPTAHPYGLGMGAVTLLALVVAERGTGPDVLSWALALAAGAAGVRGLYRFCDRFEEIPGRGWTRSASAAVRHARREP